MKTIINNSFEDFKETLSNSSKLQQEFRTDPIQALDNFDVRNPKETDSWIYRIIVISLGIAILTIIITLTIMAINLGEKLNNQVIIIFTAISSGAIGALAGLLAPSPKK